MSLKVAALYVYPVKACAGISLDEAAVEALGLAGDRRFALVDESGVAITQRDHAVLATVRASLSANKLRLDLGGLATVEVDAFHEPVAVDVWGNRIPALAASPSDTAALAEYVGAPLRLVRLDRAAQRSFADSRPVLVTTSAMLAALNAKLGKAVGMERFRPNVVLEGNIHGQALRGREVALEFEKPCERCEVTTIDQTTGARRGPEPLATLTERFGGEFGLYYRAAQPGRLQRGEEIR